MKKMTKGIFIIIATMFIFTLVPQFAVSGRENNEELSLSDIKIILADDEQALKDFNNFSNEKQEEFIEAMNNPEVFAEKSEITINTEETSFIPSDTPLSPTSISPLSNTRIRSYTSNYDVGLFGIKITQYRHIFRIETSNNRATRVLENTGIVVRNYNPMVQSGLTSKGSYISGGRAFSNVVFFYNIGPIEEISAQLGNYAHEYIINGTGIVSANRWGKVK